MAVCKRHLTERLLQRALILHPFNRGDQIEDLKRRRNDKDEYDEEGRTHEAKDDRQLAAGRENVVCSQWAVEASQ